MAGSYGTIISMDGDNAEKHYTKKLLPAWRNYPIWLKPMTSSNNAPKTIKLEAPSNVFNLKGLGSSIDYTESAGERKNDGDKLFYSLTDEAGKTTNSDIFERHNVNKLAMSLGGGTKIIGFMSYPSTVEEMDDGGMSYYKLAESSNFYKRISGKGQTHSGLARIFFPYYIGMEGFIDRFGKSVITTPSERQIRLSPDAKFAKMRKGARDVIQAERDALLKDGSTHAMEQYRSLRRKQPMEYAECWIGSSGNLGFDIEKIDKRLAELRRLQTTHSLPTIKGNFEWIGEPFRSGVRWVTVPDKGKFEICMTLSDDQANQRTEVQGWDAYLGRFDTWVAPLHGAQFTCGADVFGYDNKINAKLRDGGSRQSNGGIAILWEYDATQEKSADMAEWNSRSFVATYSHRPASTIEYLEDVLKVCIYYGAMLYAERNKDSLWQYFIERGYGGYLKYDIDMKTGKVSDKPGFFSSEQTKEELFRELKDFVNYRIHKENFISFLKELKDIKGTEQMTLYDRLTAHGAALLGSRSKFATVQEKERESFTWTSDNSFIRLRQY